VISAVFRSGSNRNSYCSNDSSRSDSSSTAGFIRTGSAITAGGLSSAFPAVDEADESDWCGSNGKCGNMGSIHVVAATERQSTAAEGQPRARLQRLGSGRLRSGLQSAATRLLKFFGYRGSIKSSMKLAAVPESAATGGKRNV
ncbi:hypothetical protein Vafri_15088, partial [Volvox africanus]